MLTAENYREQQLATQQQFKDLNDRQLKVREKQLNSDRREFKRGLGDDKERAEEYRRRQEPVPGFLTEDISDGESTLKEIDDAKDAIQKQLLEYAK